MRRARVLFVVNGDVGSAAAERARRIEGACDFADCRVEYRVASRSKLAARATAEMSTWRPDVLYCVDLALATVAAAVTAPRTTRVVIDTGDAPAAFLELISAPLRHRVSAQAMERVAMRSADTVVVRGDAHVEYARGLGARHVRVIADGVDRALLRPADDPGLRGQLGLGGNLVIGTSGYFTWHSQLGGGLGVEIVNALADLEGVHGVLIGDGVGLERLRVHAEALGVGSRLHMLGRVPYDQLARYVSLLDIALLTQTNDPSSRVRTTGKLPVFLACGRFILASRVGTAATVLPEDMLVDYNGSWDPSYGVRVANRVRQVQHAGLHPSPDPRSLQLSEQYDYDVIARSATDVIRQCLEPARVTSSR